MQIAKVRIEILPVVLPRHPVHPGRGLRVQPPVSRPQAVDVDRVQERGEPHLLVLLCDSAHAIQRAWHAQAGAVSGACRAGRVLLAQAASLPRPPPARTPTDASPPPSRAADARLGAIVAR